MNTPKPNAGIMDIQPYVGGEGRVSGVSRIVRLASNENALGCSPKALKAYQNTAQELYRYPDGGQVGIRAAIAKAHDMNPAQVFCGNGSEELITLLIRAYVGVGDEVLYTRHGFLLYGLSARAAGATPVTVPEKDLRADIDAILDGVTEKTKIVFLANPNNPTGSYLTKRELKTLAEKLPAHIVLVIDSAYAEFVREDDFEDGRDLVDAHDNVVMLRTFSKAYGLAALRLGWAYCPLEIEGVLRRIRGVFNVNAPAQAAGIAALEDKAFLQRTIEMTVAGRAMLTDALGSLGFRVFPSVGNFILVEFGDKAEKIRIALKDKGVFVRQMGVYHLPECLRITVGTAEDNAYVITTLQEVMEAL